MEDEDRAGRPVSVSTPENIAKTEEALQQDRRQTCEELADVVGVSKGTMHHILTECLKKKKVFAKWVPHLLSEEQMATRVQLSRLFLRRSRREADFLGRIVTGDETWVFSWDPELKRQSAEWRSEDSPRPQKARRKQGNLKVLHIVFFDRQGILVDWPVPPGQTVNGEYYLWFLQNKLRPAIRKKRPELLNDVIFHHDNAPPHRKREVIDILEKWGWEILPHPAYSPDLAPCDFYLFSKLKEGLRGIRFDTVEEVNNAFKQAIMKLAMVGVSDGIDRLVHRWEKCIQLDGAYVE